MTKDAALQAEMVQRARAGGMVLIGPNGQGIAVPRTKLYPWMPAFMPDPGSIGIASQSGSVATVLSQRLAEFGFGCSKVVSAGNCSDIGWPDYLEYFRRDPDTKVILLHIEGLDDGQAFFQAAKRAALAKPVVIVKAGRTQVGMSAAATHTGALAGSDRVFSAACKQSGIIRMDKMEEAVIMAAALVSTPLPAGRRVAIVTGGGGFGVIAADAAAQAGLDVVRLSEETIAKLRERLPSWWAPNNPVDLVAGLGYADAVDLIPILMQSGEVDGVMSLGMGWIYAMLDPVNSQKELRERGQQDHPNARGQGRRARKAHGGIQPEMGQTAPGHFERGASGREKRLFRPARDYRPEVRRVPDHRGGGQGLRCHGGQA